MAACRAAFFSCPAVAACASPGMAGASSRHTRAVPAARKLPARKAKLPVCAGFFVHGKAEGPVNILKIRNKIFIQYRTALNFESLSILW